MVSDSPSRRRLLLAFLMTALFAALLAAVLILPRGDDIGVGRRTRMSERHTMFDEPTRHP